jgi:hypothetical protein
MAAGIFDWLMHDSTMISIDGESLPAGRPACFLRLEADGGRTTSYHPTEILQNGLRVHGSAQLRKTRVAGARNSAASRLPMEAQGA